jgi:hypothetical protein
VKKKLLVLLATLALLVPGGSASAAPQSQTESACLSQRSKLVQELKNDALSPNSTADVADVGHATATSPSWTNPDDGRQYYYKADVWVDWLPSDPCTGEDGYAFAFNAVCKRYNPFTGALADNACNWSVYATLQVRAGDTGDFTAPYGYKHFTTQAQLTCFGHGTGYHLLPDTWGWVRTWIRVQVRFYDRNLIPVHLSEPRKTTSWHVRTGGPVLEAGSGTGVFLDSPTAPSANDLACE